MRALAAALLAFGLTACIVVPRQPYRPPPPAPAPAPRLLSQEQAIEIAFRHARDQGLRVDSVTKAHLDSAGRWHVDLRGRGDKAKVILDARDGRLVRGTFK